MSSSNIFFYMKKIFDENWAKNDSGRAVFSMEVKFPESMDRIRIFDVLVNTPKRQEAE